MRKLYEINNEIEKLLDWNGILELENGEAVDTETGEIFNLAEKLDALQVEKEEKIVGVGYYLDDLIAKKDHLKERAKEIAKKVKSFENQIESLTDYLLVAIKNQNFESEELSIKVRKSKKCVITDENAIDKKYIKEEIKYSIDKRAITDAIKNDEAVAGAVLVDNYNIKLL